MSASLHMRQLGQGIAYFPKLAKILGGVNPSIFFSQIFYWLPKANSKFGVYKTALELEEETGLSVQEQRTARKRLVELGVLIETHQRLEHRLYFNLDLARFDELMAQHSGNAEATLANVGSNSPEMQNQHSGNAEATFDEVQNQHSYKEHITTKKLQQETTSDNFSRERETPTGGNPTEQKYAEKKSTKPKTERFDGIAVLLALGVKQQTAQDWLTVRKAKHAPLTQTAIDALVREADKAGLSAQEAVQICAERGWQGFNASWNWQDEKKPSCHDLPSSYSEGTTDEELMSIAWYAMGEGDDDAVNP